MATRTRCLVRGSRMAPRHDAKADEISRANPAKKIKDFRRDLQNPVRAKSDTCEQKRIARDSASNGRQGRANAAPGTGRYHQRNDGPRRQKQHNGDDEKRREQMPVHRARLLNLSPERQIATSATSWPLPPNSFGNVSAWRAHRAPAKPFRRNSWASAIVVWTRTTTATRRLPRRAARPTRRAHPRRY